MIVRIKNLSKIPNNSSPGYIINYRGLRIKPGQTRTMDVGKVPDWIWNLAIPSFDRKLMDPSRILLVSPLRKAENFSQEEIDEYMSHFLGMENEVDPGLFDNSGNNTDVEVDEDEIISGDSLIHKCLVREDDTEEVGVKSFMAPILMLGFIGNLANKLRKDNLVKDNTDTEIEDDVDSPNKQNIPTEIKLSEIGMVDEKYKCPYCDKEYKPGGIRFLGIHLEKEHNAKLVEDE